MSGNDSNSWGAGIISRLSHTYGWCCSGLNNGSKEICQILIPSTSEYDLIWKKGLCGCDQVKDVEMRASWISSGC